MRLNEIIDLFFKGLDDVLLSLGTGGNKYKIQATKIIGIEDIQSTLNEQSIVLWGKVEKNQGILLLCMNSDDVRALVGAVEGTVPEEINETVISTLKDLGDAFLGGALSSLAQSAKKGVVQFELTGIRKGEEIFDASFYSQIQEPVICGSVAVEGNINFSFPWIVVLDNLLKTWFPIDEEKAGVEETMLTQEEIESFINNEVIKPETKKEEQTTGAKPVSKKSIDSGYRNLDVILDIQVEATARLGSVQMPLATVLSLGPGSVINVGHEVDNPIELYVNNKLIAKGDVVIVDEKFGIRITEIVSPQERIESLQ
ncbi:MAG: flagellar motor switch protein FliN [Candidatus Hydrogenedens sp.]